ncbi:hypothetical protein MICAC_4740003 [Microcystis aeruginosa PCC 9443]|uniref:Uncharacterized protein n=1 Tax=Microcystis aeruginosa PCC 9443 TaxID=1160281 RepID=I4G6N9_MICAE|nr:hypothetical protein MICAC_4740003 [Microcystis aeruginosa PCC 9443]
MSIVCDLERTNQLNLLPDKDLVDLCPHIEPYQVPKSLNPTIELKPTAIKPNTVEGSGVVIAVSK